MDNNIVFNKTEKGKEEIATKKWGLSLNLRRILILVDGKSDVANLISKGAVFKDVEPSLEELSRDGYIEIAGHSDSTGATVPEIHHSNTSSSDKDARQRLIDLAVSLLGEKDALKVVEKLQASGPALDELLTTVKSCSKIVKLTIDEGKAKQLLDKATQILR